MIIKHEFYNRYTPTVAKDLLGCFLVRKIGGKIIRAMITETEAYRGEHDLACHASKGRTLRTETLYAQPGTAYVYLIYGMYYMLNVVTEQKDYPAAVLIRAVEAGRREASFAEASEDKKVKGKRINNDSKYLVLTGPGKLTKFLQIDKTFNGHDLTKGERVWLEYPTDKKRLNIIHAPRVGIDYARHCKEWKWNFQIEN